MSEAPSLRAAVTVRYSAIVEDATRRRRSLLDALLSERSSVHGEILVRHDVQRLTIRQPGGESFSIVWREGRPAAFWDTKVRAQAALRSRDDFRAGLRPLAEQRLAWREEKDATLLEIRGSDDSLGVLRHELRFSRDERLRPFGAAVFATLFCGGADHTACEMPLDRIASAGCLIGSRTFVGDEDEPFSALTIEVVEIGVVRAAEFEPPAGYRPLTPVRLSSPSAEPPRRDPDAPSGMPAPAGAVMAAPAIHVPAAASPATPPPAMQFSGCFPSTHSAPMAATLHQDFLDHATAVINEIAGMLRETRIEGGVWTIPWLEQVAARRRKGLACFLRIPRDLQRTSGGRERDGYGLLDRIAFMNLTTRDASGLTRTQQEARAQTLGATLDRWKVSSSIRAALLAAHGNLQTLSPDEQRTVVEAYEQHELGILTVGDILTATGAPFPLVEIPIGPIQLGKKQVMVTTPAFASVGVSDIAATIDFSTLGAKPLISTARIGATGNIVLALSLPKIELSATVWRSLTSFGEDALLIGTVGLCLANPFMCPVFVALVPVVEHLMNNFNDVTATVEEADVILDLGFEFVEKDGRVEPVITVAGIGGRINVATGWESMNLLGGILDALVAGFANLFGLWKTFLAMALGPALQQWMRERGLQFPVAGKQTGLTASGGGAFSIPDSMLTLWADVADIENSAVAPMLTQVAPAHEVRTQLTTLHHTMRQQLNPQPVSIPPPTRPIVRVGSYAGVALSQNVLNYYIVHQWRSGLFHVDVVTPALIAAVGAAMPSVSGLPVPAISAIRLWPASPPRVETAPGSIVRGEAPLRVFFDDVRACFTATSGATSHLVSGAVWELSFNFSAAAGIRLSWPWLFDMDVSASSTQRGPVDERSWAWVDARVPALMEHVAPQQLRPAVSLLMEEMLRPLIRASYGVAENAPPWRRPLCATQVQASKPNPAWRDSRVYLELFEWRKTLYVLSALESPLLELVDGSGAPTLNAKLNHPQPPITMSTMSCDQGKLAATGIPMPEGP